MLVTQNIFWEYVSYRPGAGITVNSSYGLLLAMVIGLALIWK